MFSVGKFPDEDNAVEAFPNCWLIGTDHVYWPPKNKFRKYAAKSKLPDSDWQVCKVVVIGEYG